MNKINLTPEQRKALLAAIGRYTNRPTFKQYETEQAVLLLVTVAPKPKLKEIKNTSPGYERNEIKLNPKFDALTDLPAGWSVDSRYDSGGNHYVENSAKLVWRIIWNAWFSTPSLKILDQVK